MTYIPRLTLRQTVPLIHYPHPTTKDREAQKGHHPHRTTYVNTTATMCKVDIYLNADDTVRTTETAPCRLARRGLECDKAKYYHNDSPVPIPIPDPRSRYPPSPRHTPGSSPYMGTSPYMGSSPYMGASPYPAAPLTPQPGSDSETSARRRRSGSVYINVNGQRVVRVDTPHRRNRSYESREPPREPRESREPREPREPRRERTIIVENPPTTRPPPRDRAIPRTAPPSPSPAANEALRHRPVIVDDKERKEKKVRLDVPPESDGSSSGSRRRERGERRRSARELEWEREEAERQRRDEEKRERRRERARTDEEARQRAREAQIAEANRRISERAPRPVPSRRGTAYVRPTVEVPSHSAGLGVWEAEQRMRDLAVEDEEDEDEEEARRQRLRERMMPRRRATIGAGSRRARVVYGDGMYSLE